MIRFMGAFVITAVIWMLMSLVGTVVAPDLQYQVEKCIRPSFVEGVWTIFTTFLGAFIGIRIMDATKKPRR